MRESVRSYCEIGTWRGESARVVSGHVGRVVTIDLPAEVMNRRGMDEQTIAQIGMYLDGLDNVESVRADTVTLDFSTLGGPFDLIFIDGDHRAEYVERDTRNVFAHLCHENTIVVWHDYGIDPENVRWEVYYGIMAGTAQGRRHELRYVTNTKCCVFGIGSAHDSTDETVGTSEWFVSLKRKDK
jgi:predicted O-methyltransferase YrrM